MNQIFGERMKMLRKRRGMTQTELAQALGVTVATVVRYESLPLEEMKPWRVTEIAEALGVTREELTGESEAQADLEIQALARGLKTMDPGQRQRLIQMMMPLVLQFQIKEEPEDETGPSA